MSITMSIMVRYYDVFVVDVLFCVLSSDVAFLMRYIYVPPL